MVYVLSPGLSFDGFMPSSSVVKLTMSKALSNPTRFLLSQDERVFNFGLKLSGLYAVKWKGELSDNKTPHVVVTSLLNFHMLAII